MASEIDELRTQLASLVSKLDQHSDILEQLRRFLLDNGIIQRMVACEIEVKNLVGLKRTAIGSVATLMVAAIIGVVSAVWYFGRG